MVGHSAIAAAAKRFRHIVTANHPPLRLWQALSAALGMQLLFHLITSSPAYFAPVVAPALGVGEQWVGVLFTILGLSGVGISTASNAVFRQFGLIRFLQAAALMMALGLLLGATAIPWVMLVSAVLFGIAQGPAVPACTYLVSRTAPKDKLSLATSLQQTGPPLAWAIGGALIPALILLIGWRWSLVALTAPAVVAVLLLQPLRARVDSDMKTGGTFHWRDVTQPILMAWREPLLRPFCVAGIALCILHQSFVTFTVIYLTVDLHLTLVMAGFIMTAAQVAAVLSRLLWGALADRLRNDFMILAAIALVAAAAYAALAFYPQRWPVWPVTVIAILLGMTTAGWQGMFFAANARHAPPGKVVTAVAGVQFFLFIGSTGGPIAVALIVSATGDYRIVYCLLAVLAVWLGLRMLKLGRALKANH